MNYKRKLKHEFVILDKDGIIVHNADMVSEIYGAHRNVADFKSVKKIDGGYLITWDFIEERYNFLNEQLEDIKDRISLLALLRMKKSDIIDGVKE